MKESGRIESTAVGGPLGQGGFLNSVARFETDLDPDGLLALLRDIEQRQQRERTLRWGPRTLDLDLLAHGGTVCRRPDLRVPHPRMTFRPFVLLPAVEVAPAWRHPEIDASLREILDAMLRGADEVRVVGDPRDAERAGAALAQLIRIESAGTTPVRVAHHAGGAGGRAARLTVAAERGGDAVAGGPRLTLADCPRDCWREEVRAALRCVWPERFGADP